MKTLIVMMGYTADKKGKSISMHGGVKDEFKIFT